MGYGFLSKGEKMLEVTEKKIMKCDLCLKELGKLKHSKKYLPLPTRFIDFVFGTEMPDLCENCWKDTIEFVKNHRTYYKIR